MTEHAFRSSSGIDPYGDADPATLILITLQDDNPMTI
jgi:hypothetical protein